MILSKLSDSVSSLSNVTGTLLGVNFFDDPMIVTQSGIRRQGQRLPLLLPLSYLLSLSAKCSKDGRTNFENYVWICSHSGRLSAHKCCAQRAAHFTECVTKRSPFVLSKVQYHMGSVGGGGISV